MEASRKIRIAVKPIGFVRTRAIPEDFRSYPNDTVSEIVLYKEYASGLRHIEKYSHLFVLFWLHKVESERTQLLTRPKHRRELPKVGIFSTRQRNRPNPIGLTVVQLLEHRSYLLKVKGLDALDGTPVLDIKPYNDRDRPGRIKVPGWWL